ncbi:MAG: hypothetical protein KC589_00840 [Nanoarchaeota archaeon]|nr:hypothetical protein [Nanoarchaeota archaeon]
MIFNFYFLFLCLLVIQINSVYSSTQITEISFIEPEFIEIYSNQSLNLNNTKIYDENSGYNSLKLIQNKTSPFYLIVGTDFNKDNLYNISKFNCSIYTTGSTSPGKYGLKDKGENIKIEIPSNINLSLNLTYNNSILWDFNKNESLNKNLNSNNYFKSKFSFCLAPINTTNYSYLIDLNSSINENLKENETLTTPITLENSSLNNFSNCHLDFKIDMENKIFTNKIQFKFKTNIDTYQIDYWIEDYSGNLIQTKRSTTNSNLKSFTPKAQTQVYLIKASIIQSNFCSKEDSQLVVFYSKSNSNLKENIQNLQNSRDIKNTQNAPYIKILNEEDILNHKTNYLEFELFRGNSKKQIFIISQDKNKLAEIKLDKYSKLKEKIRILPFNLSSQISFQGLDLDYNIKLYPPEFNFINSSSNIEKTSLKPSFKLNINASNLNTLEFLINNSFRNISGECYITFIKTKISNTININNKENLIFKPIINISKLLNKEKLNSYPLKLTCKYKKFEQFSINYEHLEFNYEIPASNFNLNPKNINTNTNTIFTIETLNNKTNPTKSLNLNSNFMSKNQKIKSISFFPVFFATVLLLSIFIIKR